MRYFILGLVLLFSSETFPQKKGQALIDSFKTILTGYQKDQSLSRATTLNNLGRIYLTASDYTHAMQCFSESLVIADTLNDEDLKAATYKNISIVYFGQHQYNKALEYCSKAFVIFDKRNNLPEKAMLLKITGDNFFAARGIR
jgi:tetratricopeptide (TPR) repeat protein